MTNDSPKTEKSIVEQHAPGGRIPGSPPWPHRPLRGRTIAPAHNPDSFRSGTKADAAPGEFKVGNGDK